MLWCWTQNHNLAVARTGFSKKALLWKIRANKCYFTFIFSLLQTEMWVFNLEHWLDYAIHSAVQLLRAGIAAGTNRSVQLDTVATFIKFAVVCITKVEIVKIRCYCGIVLVQEGHTFYRFYQLQTKKGIWQWNSGLVRDMSIRHGGRDHDLCLQDFMFLYFPSLSRSSMHNCLLHTILVWLNMWISRFAVDLYH